jgi:hypothetical protein
MTMLDSTDSNTAKAALRITETLLEHKVNAVAGASLLDSEQLLEQSQASGG